MNRRLWFGVAMFAAFGSMYAGIFSLPYLQYPLLVVAAVTVVIALRSRA